MRFLLIVIFSGFFCMSHGQITMLDLGIGTSYYAGELNPYGKLIQLKPSGSAHLRFVMSKRHSVKFGYSYLRVEGNDSKGNYNHLTERNLYFKSDIHEISAIAELNYFEYLPGDMLHYPWTPYLFAGIAVFRMNPQGYYNNNLIDLQPLGTEGQGSSASQNEKYRLTQLAIPFGIGLRANMNRNSTISFQYGVRMLFTDYLDDASRYYIDPATLASQNGIVSAQMADQRTDEERVVGASRGNPNNKDWYFQGTVCVSFFLRKPNACDNFGRKRY